MKTKLKEKGGRSNFRLLQEKLEEGAKRTEKRSKMVEQKKEETRKLVKEKKENNEGKEYKEKQQKENDGRGGVKKKIQPK